MICKEVQNYLSSANGLPFFYFVGDEEYCSVLEELKQMNISVLRMSSFCSRDDKFPDIDEMLYYLRTSDVDYRDNKFVLVGLGEFLALKGLNVVERELGKLKNTTLGNARVILLLRGVPPQAVKLITDDNKIKGRERTYVSGQYITNISVTTVPENTKFVPKIGIKYLLETLEDGASGTIYASTALLLDNSLFTVTAIKDAYSAIKLMVKEFDICREAGTEKQWLKLLEDLNKFNHSIKNVFKENETEELIKGDFILAISGLEYRNWLAYLYLKIYIKKLQKNPYLRLVVEESTCFGDFKTNLITRITDFSHNDRNFMLFYDDRKKLLKNFPEEDIFIFVRRNKNNPDESIYRLTDNTLIEKKTAVEWITHNGLSEQVYNAISYVYPALHKYLRKYIFYSPPLSDELTEYFDLYKKQKILNCISEDFMELVKKHASEYSYAKLPTRNNAIKKIEDRENTYLYWIDALGVEYMSYITALAKERNLSIHTDIARCELPTITTINNDFYYQWNGGKKYKEESLDNIKHKEKGGYFFTDNEDPIHIPAELDVIEKAMNTAAMELSQHNCKYFVIASDHGASRLAVIKKQEVPYETDTRGEHSGRCCKFFDGCNHPYMTEENGYIVLSDYGRFSGSRAANVEVHGGATLEEVVVPVITLTLNRQTNIQIEVIEPDKIIADRHNGVTLHLFISDTESPDNINVQIDGKSYRGTSEDNMHFTFILKDIKRSKSKPYVAYVYDSSNEIGNVLFKVKGRAAEIVDDFDFDDEF